MSKWRGLTCRKKQQAFRDVTYPDPSADADLNTRERAYFKVLNAIDDSLCEAQKRLSTVS